MHDVIVIGGSYAGLAAALQLGRARRDVLIVDAGQRRNRSVAHAHGILGHDGVSPAVLAAKGKSEVLAYPTVSWLDAEVLRARAVTGGFAVSVGGEELLSKRLILATGVVDQPPPIAGIEEQWGKTVFHCPYCDGYERHRGALGVLAAGPLAGHYARIVAEWSTRGHTTLFVDPDGEAPAAEELDGLAARGIRVDRERLVEARGASAGLELVTASGRRYELSGLFVMPRPRLAVDFSAQLGCELESIPTGSFYKTDSRTKETTVRGLFACGDAALAQNSVTFAMADGVRAGVGAHQSLVFADDVHA